MTEELKEAVNRSEPIGKESQWWKKQIKGQHCDSVKKPVSSSLDRPVKQQV